MTDLTATLLEIAQAKLPTTPAPAARNALTGIDANAGKVVYDNRYVYPVTGVSLLGLLRGTATAPPHAAPFGDESYGRGYLRSADGRWKIRWTEPPLGPVDGHWELFDLRADRGENADVAAAHPDVVAQLVAQWNAYMKAVGGVEPLKPGAYY